MNKPVELLKQLNNNNYIMIQRHGSQLNIYYSFWIDDSSEKPAFLTVYLDSLNHYTVNGYDATTTSPKSVFSQALNAVQQTVISKSSLQQLADTFPED